MKNNLDICVELLCGLVLRVGWIMQNGMKSGVQRFLRQLIVIERNCHMIFNVILNVLILVAEQRYAYHWDTVEDRLVSPHESTMTHKRTYVFMF